MTNRKRIAALLVCIALVFALAVSSAFIAHEAGHDCSGNDCPICRMIALNVDLLRTFGLVVLLLLVPAALQWGKFTRLKQRRSCLPVSGTPVSRKVRLND